MFDGRSTSYAWTSARATRRHARVSRPAPRTTTESIPAATASDTLSSIYRLRQAIPAHPPGALFSALFINACRTKPHLHAPVRSRTAGGRKRNARLSRIKRCGSGRYCSQATITIGPNAVLAAVARFPIVTSCGSRLIGAPAASKAPGVIPRNEHMDAWCLRASMPGALSPARCRGASSYY